MNRSPAQKNDVHRDIVVTEAGFARAPETFVADR
jgi:hypothetical protein